MPGQEAKYQQVIDWVQENIANGTFRSGEKMMSENELAAHFGLSRQTIRRATGELENLGVLTRVRGSGTYIADPGTKHTAWILPGISPAGLPGKGETQDFPKRTKTGNIAVISTFNETYIFPKILRGLESVLTENGYFMQVTFTDNRLTLERTILRQILERDNIDGLIVEPVKSALPNPNLSCYDEIRARGIPILFFNAAYPDRPYPCVRIDDEAAGRKAAEYLLNAGHRRIGGIFKVDDIQGPMRYRGYLEAMLEAQAPLHQNNVLWLDTPAAGAISDLEEYLFRRLDGCTAVVCYNDQVAYQLIELALARGIRVPEELSVIGVDDSYLAEVCKVPLTSVSHPKEMLGEKAARNMIRLIEEPAFEAGYLFESRTVVRDSVAAVPTVR